MAKDINRVPAFITGTSGILPLRLEQADIAIYQKIIQISFQFWAHFDQKCTKY
jgi:hypothetical protein